MSNLVSFAKSELEKISSSGDEMQERMNENILQMVQTFSEQGHSGFSASYALATIQRLLTYKPLTPLTGEDAEWVEVSESEGVSLEQNKRRSSVFRMNRDNKTAYDIDGKIFSDNGGDSWFSSNESRVPIEFPYTVPDKPEKVIIK